MTLSVSLDEPTLAVEPGESVRFQARVRNSSSRRRKVRVQVSGPAAPWSWVIPPDLLVEARSEALASVGFRVPDGCHPPAGPLPFDLVISPDRPGAFALSAAGVLTVAERRQLALELGPPDSKNDRSARRRLTLHNRGNVVARITFTGSTPGNAIDLRVDPDVLAVEPGQRSTAVLSVQARRRPLVRGRSTPFAVSAVPDHGAPLVVQGEMHQPGRTSPRALALGLAMAVLGTMVGLRATVLAPASTGVAATAEEPRSPSPASTNQPIVETDPACPAKGHIDTRGVTGLTPEDIPTLPADYSFFKVNDDGCTPMRWNPCEPVRFIINPDGAPPTGVADVREAFTRLGQATGITYVDEGITDERGGRDRAYQPRRYGERWAPILVQWQDQSNRNLGSIQVVGSGFPTAAGGIFVTGNLTLNSGAVTNTVTRTPLAGGFGSADGVGPIGPRGVTWGRVILHELGHIAGLGHVRDPGQLMYPETTKGTIRPTRFGRGDAEGLRLLGTAAGCLKTPPVTTPTIT